MFEVRYEPLDARRSGWGRLAVLPWDTEIFGFAVAEYQPGDAGAVARERPAFRSALVDWARSGRVEIVSCSVPSDDARWIALLPRLGFTFLDSTLSFTFALRRLERGDLPRIHAIVRRAVPADLPEVEQIAERAFRFGRYHADARFPPRLADLRYRRWMRNAFASLGPANRVYVVGEPGRVRGFSHIVVSGDRAQMTIEGVAPEYQPGTAAFDLIAGLLFDLKDEGVRVLTSKVSATNTPVINMAAYFGSRFSDPRALFAWHAPRARHLVPWDQVYG